MGLAKLLELVQIRLSNHDFQYTDSRAIFRFSNLGGLFTSEYFMNIYFCLFQQPWSVAIVLPTYDGNHGLWTPREHNSLHYTAENSIPVPNFLGTA